jgi:hypothetical protein
MRSVRRKLLRKIWLIDPAAYFDGRAMTFRAFKREYRRFVARLGRRAFYRG